jgi:uncharacterized repeat protein (TIGR01451 family)
LKVRAILGLLALTALGRGLQGSSCFEGAEGPSTAWSMTDLWHVEDAASAPCAGAHSGTHAFYYGIDSQCNYNNGQIKEGFLTSPPFIVTGAGDTNFSFWTKWQVESLNPSCYDQLWIERLSATAGTWTLLAQVGPVSDPPNGAPLVGVASVTGVGGTPQWEFVQIDLSLFAGPNPMQLRFHYLSSACLAASCGGKTCNPPDDNFDSFLGWVVDDISLGCPSGELVLAKSANPSFAARGDAVTYVISAKNLDASSQSLTLWDTLPTGADYVGASGPATRAGQLVSWSLPPLASQASQSVSVWVSVDPATPYPSDWMNTASGSSSAGGAAFTSAVAPVKIREKSIQIMKSASPSSLVSGQMLTYTIALSNFSASTAAEVDISELFPVGFVETGGYPAFSATNLWQAFSLLPGQTSYFSVWGLANGFSGQVLTNQVQALSSGQLLASASASVTLQRPFVPQLSVQAVYPNPAPSGKAGMPQSAFVVVMANEPLNVTMDIFDIAGEKIRSIPCSLQSGQGQVEWDLKNGSGVAVASGVYFGRLWTSDPQSGLVQAWAHIAVVK